MASDASLLYVFVRSVQHVKLWIQWAVRQFNLTGVKLSDWNINGTQLCAINNADFKLVYLSLSDSPKVNQDEPSRTTRTWVAWWLWRISSQYLGVRALLGVYFSTFSKNES